MALPTRTLTGTYKNLLTDAPLTGEVDLHPYPNTWHDTVGHEVRTGGGTLTLVNGAFTSALVTTDAAGVDPSGGRLWKLTERITGRPVRRRFFLLPLGDGTPLDVTQLVVADPGQLTYLPVQGIPGTAGADGHDGEDGHDGQDGTDGQDGRDLTAGPWQFNIVDYGAVGDAKTVHDGAVTGGVATLTCATSTPFAIGHVGKSVLIKGAGPAGVTSFRTTIAGYSSAGVVTLTDTPPTSVTGAVVHFGTNNYTAIRLATAAAEAYLNGTGTGPAATPHTYARVYTPPGAYVIDGPLDTSKSGNGQIAFGVYPTTDVKRILHFRGEGSGAGVRHWEQLVPQTGGSCWISFGFYASTSAQTTDLNANGNPGIISGPNEGTVNGLAFGASARYSNVMVILQDMALLNAHTAFGITYGAFNLYGCANAHIENVSYGTAGVVPGTDYSSPGTFGTGLVVGALMPANGNNDLNVLRNVSCQGGYTYGMFLTEHAVADRLMFLYCWAGLCPVGTYASSVGAVHAMKVLSASIEQCGRQVYVIGPGSEGVGPRIDIDQLQTESGSPTFDGNSTAALAAAEGRIVLTGLFTPAGVNIVQPSGIELVNGQVPRAITLRSANYGASPIDRTVLMDTTSGNLTLSLPSADFNPVEFVAKNVGSGVLTVAALTSPQQKIDGANSVDLAANAVARLQAKFNGVAWSWYRV